MYLALFNTLRTTLIVDNSIIGVPCTNLIRVNTGGVLYATLILYNSRGVPYASLTIIVSCSSAFVFNLIC